MVEVILEEDMEPRAIAIPPDVKGMLEIHPGVLEVFNGLSYSHQKEYIRWIEEAKQEETRLRRVMKMIKLLIKP